MVILMAVHRPITAMDIALTVITDTLTTVMGTGRNISTGGAVMIGTITIMMTGILIAVHGAAVIGKEVAVPVAVAIGMAVRVQGTVAVVLTEVPGAHGEAEAAAVKAGGSRNGFRWQ